MPPERGWGKTAGPINVHSDVDTDDDSGGFDDEPDGSFTVAHYRQPHQDSRQDVQVCRARTTGTSAAASDRSERLDWWAVSTAYTWACVALRWSWAVIRPCKPPPPHGVKLADVDWPHLQGCHLPRGAGVRAVGPTPRRRRKARLRVPSWLLLGGSRPRRGRVAARERQPGPRYKGLDRGDRVREEPRCIWSSCKP